MIIGNAGIDKGDGVFELDVEGFDDRFDGVADVETFGIGDRGCDDLNWVSRGVGNERGLSIRFGDFEVSGFGYVEP